MKRSTTGRPLPERRKPSFFKVLSDRNFSSRVQIPPAFVKKYGKYLLDKIMLKNYFNESWEVEVEKTEANAYFGNGWETFVKDNKLEFCDFVWFKYSYNSAFKFKTYGKLCCEKKIERARKLVGIGDENQEQVKGDVQNGKSDLTAIDSDDDDDGQLKHSVRKQKREESVMLQLSKGINFDSPNPSFLVKLTSTYVHSCYLAVPVAFLRKLIMKVGYHKIKLETSEKIWDMNLYMFSRKDMRRQEARFTNGWVQFVRENELKEGDDCIFEMLETHPTLLFWVHVKRSVLLM